MFITGLLAFAAAGSPLEAVGKWTVDYRPDTCIASRAFGAEATPIYLSFQPIISLDAHMMRLSVLAPNTEGSGITNGKATIKLLPTGATATVAFDSWVTKSGGPRGYEMIADIDALVRTGEPTALTIDTGKQSFSFATGKVRAVVDAANKCNDDLLRSWGVDPAARAEPVGNPGTWFTNDDYPAAAAQRRAQGHVVAVLIVDNDGKLKECKIAVSSGDPDLDAATCTTARKNARFTRQKGSDRFSLFSVHWSVPK